MRRYLVAAVISLASAAALPARGAMMHNIPGHGPPDVRQLYICRVEPRSSGTFCTSPPYAPVGKRCTCEGPHGPRPGRVEHR
jgi:hypothetical protein